jgi:hypothetical protein
MPRFVIFSVCYGGGHEVAYFKDESALRVELRRVVKLSDPSKRTLKMKTYQEKAAVAKENYERAVTAYRLRLASSTASTKEGDAEPQTQAKPGAGESTTFIERS